MWVTAQLICTFVFAYAKKAGFLMTCSYHNEGVSEVFLLFSGYLSIIKIAAGKRVTIETSRELSPVFVFLLSIIICILI